MWGVDPKLLCDQHLLGEHLEMHMFRGVITSGQSITGYIKNGLVEVNHIKDRHDELVVEMKRRGMNHKSPLLLFEAAAIGHVDRDRNLEVLSKRCGNCRRRIERAKES